MVASSEHTAMNLLRNGYVIAIIITIALIAGVVLGSTFLSRTTIIAVSQGRYAVSDAGHSYWFQITYKEVEVIEEVPFQTINENDPNLPQGQSLIRQEGMNGFLSKTCKVTYMGEKELSRALVSEHYIKQPVNASVALGTYVAPQAPIVTVPSTTEQTDSGARWNNSLTEVDVFPPLGDDNRDYGR